MSFEHEDIVEKFRKAGVVVISDVLSPRQVLECREGLHNDLLNLGIDHEKIQRCAQEGEALGQETHEALRRAQAHATGAIPLLCSPWRLEHCSTNERLRTVHQSLWSLYATGEDPAFSSYRAGFDPSVRGFPLLDPIGYRMPTSVVRGSGKQRVQRALNAHLDLNPWRPWDSFIHEHEQASQKASSEGEKPEANQGASTSIWRPTQCFIALTKGSFLCQKGCHTEFDNVFSTAEGGSLHGIPEARCKFFSLCTMKRFAAATNRFEEVTFEAGDAVIWDSRIPHATAESHDGTEPREVVYSGWLPPITENQRYAQEQAHCVLAGKYPPNQSFGVAPMARAGTGSGTQMAGLIPGWDPEALDGLSSRVRDILGLDRI